MYILFICSFLSSIMYGALSEDRDDGVQAQRIHAVTGLERLLKTHCGPHYWALQEGRFDEYWGLVRADLQKKLYSFKSGLIALEDKMVVSWQDPYQRMQWVKDVRADLIAPLEALCARDKVFTCESCFADVPVQPGVGQMLLEQYQWIRKYTILSAVATYLSLDTQEPMAHLKGSHRECVSVQRQIFIKHYKPFLRSKDGFIKLCQAYLSEELPQANERSFIEWTKANLRDGLYHLYMVAHTSTGVRGKGVLSPTGQVLIPEKFVALQEKILLHGMPYMEKGVESLFLNHSWYEGSQSIFARDSFYTRRMLYFAASWSNIYPNESYPFAHIIEAMHVQMKKAQKDPEEMLKIMVTFDSALSHNNCANVQNAQEHIKYLQSCKYYGLTDVWQDIMDTLHEDLGQAKALDYVNGCYQRYFIEGVKGIIVNFHTHGLLRRQLCEQEYNFGSHQSANLWTTLDAIAYSCAESGIDRQLQILYVDKKPQMSEEAYVKHMRSLLQARNLTGVCYGWWSEPVPVVDWNNALKVLVVLLPKKASMLPNVIEMQSFRARHPISFDMSLYAIRDFISYQFEEVRLAEASSQSWWQKLLYCCCCVSQKDRPSLPEWLLSPKGCLQFVVHKQT